MRTCPSASGGRTKTVSLRFISRASGWSSSSGMSRASVKTASGLPASGVSVKTSATTWRKLCAKPATLPADYGRGRETSPVRSCVSTVRFREGRSNGEPSRHPDTWRASLRPRPRNVAATRYFPLPLPPLPWPPPFPCSLPPVLGVSAVVVVVVAADSFAFFLALALLALADVLLALSLLGHGPGLSPWRKCA